MKEISEKLAKELHDMICNAELQSGLAYKAAKKGDVTSAKRHAMSASVFAFQARVHLDWHMFGYLDSEQQAAPVDVDE